MNELEEMERNDASLRTRVITATIYSATLIAMTLISSVTTVIAVAALSGLCAFEFYTMLRSDAKLPNELIGTIAATLYPVSYALGHFNGVLTLTATFATVVLVWYVFYPPARITDVAVTFFGALYTGLMLSFLVVVRADIAGFWGGFTVVAIMASVWLNDTFAFFIGSKFGRHKMAPRISPNKSWEGFLAGMVASVGVWLLMMLIPSVHLPVGWAIAGGIACGCVGILGDLVESRIKRSTGHKDSGHLLPGHGGFLDRCDSLILVAAMASLILRLSGTI